MSLWRVDIAGVSTRYVDAESARHAIEEVRELLMATIDIRATKAGNSLQRGFEQADPTQRRRLLDDLDSLASPRAIRSARGARRRLAREIRFDIERRAWIESQLELASPISPDAADAIVRHVELSRLTAQGDVESPTETEYVARAVEA